MGLVDKIAGYRWDTRISLGNGIEDVWLFGQHGGIGGVFCTLLHIPTFFFRLLFFWICIWRGDMEWEGSAYRIWEICGFGVWGLCEVLNRHRYDY